MRVFSPHDLGLSRPRRTPLLPEESRSHWEKLVLPKYFRSPTSASPVARSKRPGSNPAWHRAIACGAAAFRVPCPPLCRGSHCSPASCLPPLYFPPESTQMQQQESRSHWESSLLPVGSPLGVPAPAPRTELSLTAPSVRFSRPISHAVLAPPLSLFFASLRAGARLRLQATTW